MPRRELVLLMATTGLLAACHAACHPSERYESVCQLLSNEVVEVDEKGRPTMIDLELEWDPCPGQQFQVVRGGAELAACMKPHKIGDLLSVEVVHFWDVRGFYRWDLTKIGGCERAIEPDAEGSYEKSQECHDIVHYGQKTGFMCSRKPFRGLVEVCPWLARD